MRRTLRHHRYALRVALGRLAQHPFSTLANVLVISLTLALPIIAASILVSVQPVARDIPVSPEATLLIRPGTDMSATRELARRLEQEHGEHIASVRVVPRDEALETMKQNPAWTDALSVLPDNPLPDAIVVTLRDLPEMAQEAARLATLWRQLDNVDAVQLDRDWVRRLEALLHAARVGLGLLAVGVALVVLATVFNTVRMQALTQREEIGVARLVGATESFVRRPFLYLGGLTGLVSSILAIGLARAALAPLNEALARLSSTYGTEFTLHLPDALSLLLATIFVAILAALSARLSVTRNTQF
ncbi:MAG: ABC transporter permease [Candidimonas sp.]|jgi:cell division transport system permease protein